jgi:SAM-dependent methyltransferase
MKSAVCEVLVSLLGFALIGCGADRRDNPSPFLLQDENRQAAPTAPAAAASPVSPGMTGATAGGNKSAVVFVEFVATPQDVVERMLEIAEVTKSDVLYDLGCGDGRIVVTAARKYGCKAVGYDLDPLRLEEARKNAARHGVSHLVTLERQDVLKADLQEASVVTLYLGTEINARLIPQLEKLRPGARIVSHEFAVGDIPPDKTVDMISHTDGLKHTIYLWTCPLPARSRRPANSDKLLLRE